MVSVELDKSKRLLVISAGGHVSNQEVKEAANQVRDALRDVTPGVRALTDFRGLESMLPSSAPHIAAIMDALANKEVASVIRIIRDPGKDMAFNILHQFRYSHELPITTVTTLVDALDSLSEQTAGGDEATCASFSNPIGGSRADSDSALERVQQGDR